MQALLTSDDGLTRPIRAQSVSLLAAPSSAMYMISGFSCIATASIVPAARTLPGGWNRH
jgi:hypothetical protein